MTKGFAIDSTGQRLKLLEKDVSKQINDFLKWNGWDCVRTDVIRAHSDRGFINQGEKGQSDWICTRPVSITSNHSGGLCHVFLREDKRKGGAIEQHQTDWNDSRELRGYLKCIVPPDVPDGLEWFKKWFRAHYEDSRI